MRILAFDTSLSACSAAVWQDGKILSHRFEVMERGQSEALLPMIEAVMLEAKMDFKTLDLIGTTVGPGAFTGLRIGLAAARAISLGSKVPVAGISTLEALGYAIPVADRAGRDIVAVVDSKREDVFVQRFDAALNALGPIETLSPDMVFADLSHPVIAVGNGLSKVGACPSHVVLAQASPFPDASLVAALVADRHLRGATLPPGPLYLRAADTTCAPKAQPTII